MPPSVTRFVVPEVVISQFHVREGDVVADFGAGSGFFIGALQAAVGQTGRVYACEIQRGLVDKLGNLVRTKGYANVDVLWSDLEAMNGTKLPDSTLDVGILVNTLFQLEDKTTAVQEVRRTIRVGGKCIVIDWSESFAGLGPTTEMVVGQGDAVALMEANGFVLDREFPAGDHHYGLAFRAV